MGVFLGTIILCLFACIWIGVVCKVLGFVQNKYQRLLNDFKERKER